MSLDLGLPEFTAPDWGHIDDDGDLLAAPADEQPVSWDDDDLYARDES